MASRTDDERASFNADPAQQIADAIGIHTRSARGRSARFAYFEDDERFLVVAGAQEGRDTDLALAYGLTWRGDKHLELALPAGSQATRQRLPWVLGGRVRLWELTPAGVSLVEGVTREAALAAVREQSAADVPSGLLRPDDELESTTPVLTQLGEMAAAMGLDPAHRPGAPAWHTRGLRVLSVSTARGTATVRAGVHRSAADQAPTTVESAGPLSRAHLDTVRSAVQAGIAERLGVDGVPGSLHRPDEHWLQSVLRSAPGSAGLAAPVYREVAAWRPTDGPGAWARGFIDLVGRTESGAIGIVETKLTSNEDTRFLLQGLDYWVWATAHREVLAQGLGLPMEAPVELGFVVGADESGAVALSRYARAIAGALDPAVPRSFSSVSGWFDGTPSASSSSVDVPAHWSNAGRPSGNRFVDAARTAAIRWKAASPSITPDEARAPGPYVRTPGAAVYDFCLPLAHADLNLLPEVRATALEHFRQHDIVWHRGTDAGPTTHLLSSQVQCVNALGQMVTDPDRIRRAFGAVLDLGDVIPFDDGTFLTFEWVPDADVLNESGGGQLRRGRGNTSLDAAFRYVTSAGAHALALIEWKFTESYTRARPEQAASDKTRRGRYEALVDAPSGPITRGEIPFEDLLDEPFYQLVRQQLLAHAVETGSDPAQEVHVVHVLPRENEAYRASVVREPYRSAGATVQELWERLYPAQLTPQTRYHQLDSAVFLDGDLTSAEYVARYTVTPA